MPTLALDADGEASLVGRYQGREVAVSFVLREERHLLVMKSDVLAEWKGDSSGLAAMLLSLNRSPDDTLGAAFAVSRTDDVVRVTPSLLSPLTHHANFCTALLRMFALSGAWQENFDRNPVLARGQAGAREG